MDETNWRKQQLQRLSRREMEVLALRCAGKSQEEIRRQLVIELRTVKFHLGNIYQKLGLDNQERSARQFALFGFCQALGVLSREEVPPPREPGNEPEPPPPQQQALAAVDEDERWLVREQQGLIWATPQPAYAPPPAQRTGLLIVVSSVISALVAVAALIGVALFLGIGRQPEPAVQIMQVAVTTTPVPGTGPTLALQPVATNTPAPTASPIPPRPQLTATPRGPTPTSAPPTATPGPPPPPGTVLYEADWSVGLAGWASATGWKALDGMLLNDGTQYSPRTWHDDWNPAPLALGVTRDYRVEAEIQRVRGCGSYGIVVRDGYQAGIYACTSAFALIVSRPDQRLAERDFGINNDWKLYRVEVRGNTLRLLIDGAVVLEVTDNRYIDAGKVGLWSNGAQISVRSFNVIAQ